MTTTTCTTDVLVVGAGPAGTALAIDLARRGVAVRLIDKAPHAFDGSRAKGIQPRTLEILDDLGALGDIIDQAQPCLALCDMADHRPVPDDGQRKAPC